jgi:hypothetical protein
VSNATLSLLPWVRQGAVSAIDAIPDSTSPVATVSPQLTLNQQTGTIPQVSITLRGPADVIGIDANQVVRTDPRPGTADFEPNCFPSVEFDRPDFPWLFTPTQPGTDNRLRPWLCLITVRKQDGVTLSSTPNAPLPILTIDSPAVPANELPDLTDSWAWAHAQVAADKSAIDSAFAGGPELTLSRLISPRFLEHDTDYIACVVPTFDVGRKTGLGEPATPGSSDWTLAPAWSSAAQTPVRLPVYYYWEFRTGQQGDFESLARRLTAGVPEGVGTRTIDVSHPCFDAAGASTLEMEGALVAASSSLIVPGAPALPDPIPADFKVHLASIINPPTQARATSDTSDPVLAPPLYGQWHAATPVVFPDGTSWLDQLNLDPRWRAAAALGTTVIQRNQDALMASAWEQAAALQQANQRARQMQLSLAVGGILRQRHFATTAVTEDMALRIAAPAFARLPAGPKSMLTYQTTRTWLPVAANRAAMRRIGRQRGPLTRRVASKGNFSRSPDRTWTASLNQTFVPNPPSAPQPPPAPQYTSLPSLALFTQALQYTTDNPPLPQSYYGAFFVAAEGAPVTAPGTLSLQKRAEAPDFFRSAAQDHLARVFPPRPTVIRPQFIISSFGSVKQTVLDNTDPQIVLPKLFNAVVSTGDRVLAPTAKGVTPTGVETVMAAPYFPQPMYETLRDISRDWLLLGVDKVEPDTVLGLQTNRRFVESYMVGLNHEMGRELLWRGYPTDQRGTYFDHFWGNGVPNTAPSDITNLNLWSVTDPVTKRLTRQLGDATGTTSTDEFVMVMRSSLLRRYPNAVIYMAPAQNVGTASNPVLVPNITAPEVLPSFSGSMQPDIAFFGFPVTPGAAAGTDGTLGYYVIIQEHPTEPRFGIDAEITTSGTYVSVAAPPSSLNVTGWNTNAAATARITRRLPVRMAIHAARLISST